ncbi:MAG: PilT/PilU family type 4a pilus ATPase [Gammaproteobacteria bacterium]|nr:PilT/PilU family type 4a pilus ATPase [Gammaproteobacteria bacterium]
MDILPYLKLMAEKGASDLFFSTGAPVNIKIEGVSAALNDTSLPPGVVKKLAYSVISDDQQKTFEAEMELNLAISVHDIGRFRINLYRQRGEVAMVVRYLKSHIPSIENLHLPAVLKELIMEPRGLILLVGSTGSGKSTTLASMIDHRNANNTGHILTIEEPIEFIHQHKKSIVDQREVGLDTLSYANALKNAMREAPDVILIGEIRDRETMQHAIAYAETGHLCLSTLHANNANQTLDRIINFFPDPMHHQLLLDLSLNLRAVVSQRLVSGVQGKRVPAVEIMLKSPYISELIEKGDIEGIKDAIGNSTEMGMQSFDQSLYELYSMGKISMQEALNNADSRNNLMLKFRLARGVAGGNSTDDLSITEENDR